MKPSNPDRPEIFLSLVIPAYNESERIRDPLRRMSDYLSQQPYRSEMILVDDGSADETFDLAREIGTSLEVPLHLIRYAPNRGKGFALKVGFAASKGRRVLFTDADLATPIEEASRLLESLDQGYDIAVGTRHWTRISVRQPWHREWMGKAYTWLVRLLVANVSDVTCGFKAFEGEIGREIFSRTRVYGWSIDAELLLLARKLECRIQEVPVQWHDVEGTKVRLVRDVVSSLADLARVRLNSISGAYRVRNPIDTRTHIWVAGASAGLANPADSHADPVHEPR